MPDVTSVRRLLGAIVRHPEADLSKLPITLDLQAINIVEGLRAALSVAVIVALNEWLEWPLMMEAALASWLACLCDQGGPIQRRLPAVLGFTLAGAAITAGAGLARNGGLAAALPLASLGLFCLSFLRVYGQSAMVLGNLLSVALVLALDQPLGFDEAGVLAGAFLGGGLWATVLTMVIWRVHPYLPARAAVARAYRALAQLVHDLRDKLRSDVLHETAWEEHARAHRRGVRDAIEQARAAVMDTVRVRGAVSARGAQSLIRLEVADQVFGAMIAFSDLLEGGEAPADRAAIDRVLRRVRALLVVLARGIVSDDVKSNPQIARSMNALAEELATLPLASPFRQIGAVLVERLRIAQTLALPANYLAGTLKSGERPPLWDRIVRPLRANLHWESLSLRHALRVAVVAVPAITVSVIWAGPYQHWLTITWVLTMQPQFAMTITRALERIGGTVLGGGIAALIATACRTPIAMAGAIFPLAVIALAVRQVSFGLFMTAVTPMIVLLSEIGRPGTSEWEIVGMRALFTLVGGVLALAGCLVMWPAWEPGRLRQEIGMAIEAHGRYATEELSAIVGEATPETVDQARRAAGVASNNMESSLSRALQEPGKADRFRLEAALVIDAALRRLAGRLSAMQLTPGLRDALPRDDWIRWRNWIAESMQALSQGAPVLSLKPRPDFAGRDAIEALSRIARQIELMAGAMQRVADNTSPGTSGSDRAKTG